MAQWLANRNGRVLSMLLVAFVMLLGTQGALGKTKVTYWNMHGRASFDEALVEEFNRTHPHIEVEQIPVPGSYANISQLVAAQVAGDLPDLIYLDRGAITSLKLSGLLMDLTPYIQQSGWQLEDEWFPATLGTVTLRGRYYGIPRDAFPMSVFIWNKRLFAEAGLDPNVPPTTLESLEQFHRRLMRLGAEGTAEQVGFIPWLGIGQYGLVQSLMWGSNWWDSSNHQTIVSGERNLEMMNWLSTWAQQLQPLIGSSWERLLVCICG